MRLLHFYRALSAFCDITLLSSTDFGARFEEIFHTGSFRELRFPKDEHWREAYRALESAELSGDLSGLAFAMAVSHPHCALRITARRIMNEADAIVHEFPYSAPIFDEAEALLEIYNSHNFEASLLPAIVHGSGRHRGFLRLVALERSLANRARLVCATSDTDAVKFRLFYGVSSDRLHVCPNGFVDGQFDSVSGIRQSVNAELSARPRLLFMGSGHPPNVEAADFLVRLADELSDCVIVIAGGVCGHLAHRALPLNVELAGAFDDVDKQRLLSAATLYLNPVVLGSGTSLKAVEALAAGIPMVSTSEGVRGLPLTSGAHCLIADRRDFAESVRDLIVNPKRAEDMAARGRSCAMERLRWSVIAREAYSQIAAALAFEPNVIGFADQRPVGIALNDFPVVPAHSGGAVRIRRILDELESDVIFVCFGDEFAIDLISDRILHVQIKRTDHHQEFESRVNRDQTISINDAVAALFVAGNVTLKTILGPLLSRAAWVIFEHCYMAPLIDFIRSIHPALPVIYSAHNIETLHKRTMLNGHPLAGLVTEFISRLEERLVETADILVACTETDAEHFSRTGRAPVLVANGCVAVPETEIARLLNGHGQDAEPAPPRIGFLGSSHPPNIDAANFIIDDLATSLPNIRFELVGSVCTALDRALPANVKTHGIVAEPDKRRILASWDVALNPLLEGGGSSLKLPDYFAHALPTISTSIGARGFGVCDNDLGVVAERCDFADRIDELLSAPETRHRFAKRAHVHASEHLTWKSVTKEYNRTLSGLAVKKPRSPAARSLLIVTYRYTEPARGGAEQYLIEVLQRLKPKYARIELAAVAVDFLTNEAHFATAFSHNSAAPANFVGEIFDSVHFFPALEQPAEQVQQKCRSLERAWLSEEFVLCRPFCKELCARGPHFLSGFFAQERHGQGIRRWTSGEFWLVLPENTRTLRVAGWVPHSKRLTLSLYRQTDSGELDEIFRSTRSCDGNFVLNFAVDSGRNLDGVLLAHCAVPEHVVETDHRPLGVLIEAASVLVATSQASGDDRVGELDEMRFDLSASAEQMIRAMHFDRWVAALNRSAKMRPPELDEEFAEIRGPHSPALQDWLSGHASDYDVVLVQGIPFDTIPRSVETICASANRPRVVLLPHFHGDDRFYYWPRYLNAFAKADATLLFSSTIAHHLGDGIHAEIVPGGGVNLEEFASHQALSRWRAISPITSPFFLVLGRKTASKGYQRAIEAVQLLRQTGIAVNLAIIGVDEDGVPIREDGVTYLGHQPREIVTGALADCSALVTMSESESFGIVICEAWKFGKPVIANRSCYAFRELVSHDRDGLLVEGVAELSEAMKRLILEPDLCSRLGSAGFDRVVREFTWDQIAIRFADLL